MSRSSRRNSRLRAVASVINAQANLEGTQARRAQINLDNKRFDDAVAQRGRFIPVLTQAVAAHEIKVFEYTQILANSRNDITSQPEGPHR